VVFHLMGAMREYGKLGAICIAENHSAAARLYTATLAALDRATQAQRFETRKSMPRSSHCSPRSNPS
jgi:hypothetical protein